SSVLRSTAKDETAKDECSASFLMIPYKPAAGRQAPYHDSTGASRKDFPTSRKDSRQAGMTILKGFASNNL
ncbi:MAG: hypothetical protein V3R54_04955, partial [Thermodesulfovibrionia bacterium]